MLARAINAFSPLFLAVYAFMLLVAAIGVKNDDDDDDGEDTDAPLCFFIDRPKDVS